MEILSRPISERTSEFVLSIQASGRLPICYYGIEHRPNARDSVAGAVDPHGTDGVYKVWLDRTLPQEAFETDLLHELHHITQVESGFSEVHNKDTLDFHSPDRPFVQEVGSHLSSVILDVEVNAWLTSIGYSYSFFTDRNFKGLLHHCSHKYTLLDDPLNFANLACSLLHASLYVDDGSAQALFTAYSAYPRVVAAASELRNSLMAMTVDSPQSALLAHCLILDSLNLWKYYYAATPRIKIRTHGEYTEFRAQTIRLSGIVE